MTTETIEKRQARLQSLAEIQAEKEAAARQRRIFSAQSIWEGAEPIQGTLAERYFREHRGISGLERMEIRYWPPQAKWHDYDEQGLYIEKTNKIPAAVLAVKNAEGKITGVQRIYLDSITAKKNARMDNPKLSKGIVQEAAAVVQAGRPGSKLYVAEGPETAASIASLYPEATVIASLGINNLGKLAGAIQAYKPGKVVLAADQDGTDTPTYRTTLQAFQTLKTSLKGQCKVQLAFPDAVQGQEKVDWNDVLLQQGADALKAQLAKASQRVPEQKTEAPDARLNKAPVFVPARPRDLSAVWPHVFNESQALAGTLGERYWQSLTGHKPPDTLDARFHAKLWNDEIRQDLPAIVMPALGINHRGQASRQGIQVTYLDPVSGEQAKLQAPVQFYGQGDNLIALQTPGKAAECFIAFDKESAAILAVQRPGQQILMASDKTPAFTLAKAVQAPAVMLCVDAGQGRAALKQMQQTLSSQGLTIKAARTGAQTLAELYKAEGIKGVEDKLAQAQSVERFGNQKATGPATSDKKPAYAKDTLKINPAKKQDKEIQKILDKFAELDKEAAHAKAGPGKKSARLVQEKIDRYAEDIQRQPSLWRKIQNEVPELAKRIARSLAQGRGRGL